MLQHSQAKLPMPTAYDGTSNFMDWAHELRTLLFINNFEYVPQLDEAQNHDTELTLDDIVEHTTVGAIELAAINSKIRSGSGCRTSAAMKLKHLTSLRTRRWLH